MKKNELTIETGKMYKTTFAKDGFIVINGAVLNEDLLNRISYFQSSEDQALDNGGAKGAMAAISRIYSFLIFANGEIWTNEKLNDEVFEHLKELTLINDFIDSLMIQQNVKENIVRELK